MCSVHDPKTGEGAPNAALPQSESCPAPSDPGAQDPSPRRLALAQFAAAPPPPRLEPERHVSAVAELPPVNLSSGPASHSAAGITWGPCPAPSARAGARAPPVFPFRPRPLSGSFPLPDPSLGPSTEVPDAPERTTGGDVSSVCALRPTAATYSVPTLRRILTGADTVPSPSTEAGFLAPAPTLDASGRSPDWPWGSSRAASGAFYKVGREREARRVRGGGSRGR